MNVESWIKEILASRERKAMPIMTHPGIEMLGRKVVDAVSDGDIHYQAIEALNNRFPQSMACTSIMDLTVEAEAFGAQLCVYDDELPSIQGHLLNNYDDVLRLGVPSLDKARVPEFLKVSALASKALEKPFFAGCIGPYSLAGRLMGMTEIMIAIYTEPQTVTLLLDKCTDFLMSYVSAIKATGVAGVVMAEPAAGLLSDEDCTNYSSIYIKKIVEAVQDETFAVVLHNCGNTGQCTQAMLKTEAKCLHFGNQIDMIKALDECPSDMLVMGNLDPVGVMKMGNADDVRTQTLKLLEEAGSYQNFILSTGCDVPPNIPMENIQAFYDALDSYNARH